MKEVAFITGRDAENGFALAGVRQLTVDAGQAEEALQQLLADDDVGVIALEESLAGTIGEQRLQEMTRRWPGVLVTLPAPEGKPAAEADALQRLVQRALGYHVRLDR